MIGHTSTGLDDGVFHYIFESQVCGIPRQPAGAETVQLLMYDDGPIGWTLKSKENCNPIIVAPGHRVSMESSIEIVKHGLREYKLPEPTRQVHIYANLIKRTQWQ